MGLFLVLHIQTNCELFTADWALSAFVRRCFSLFWVMASCCDSYKLILVITSSIVLHLKLKLFSNSFSFHSHCRLKREEGGGSIIIQTMAQPQQMQQQNMQSMDGRPLDHDEKKMRRQIANSNERRRMQSINAGFQSLRQLLPHHEGEKLSKVSQSFLITRW